MTQPDTSGRDVWGAPYTDYANTGDTVVGNATIEDVVTHQEANGHTVNPDELTGYHNVGHTDDYLNQNAGLFRTNKPTQVVHVSVSRPVPGVSSQLITAPGLLVGWAFRETAGASAVLRLRSGVDVSQAIVLSIALAANESTRDFPPLPIEFRRGLFLEVVSGTIEGNIFTQEDRHV